MPFSPKRRDLMAPVTDLGWKPAMEGSGEAKAANHQRQCFFVSIRFISSQSSVRLKKKQKSQVGKKKFNQSKFWAKFGSFCWPNWWGPLPIHWRSSLFSSPKHVGSPSHWTSGSCWPPRWLGAGWVGSHETLTLDISFWNRDGKMWHTKRSNAFNLLKVPIFQNVCVCVFWCHKSTKIYGILDFFCLEQNSWRSSIEVILIHFAMNPWIHESIQALEIGVAKDGSGCYLLPKK